MKRDKIYLHWRFLVMRRDGNHCVMCDKGPKGINVHHLVPKNFEKWELDVENGISLCPTHHTLGKHSAHKNPIWFYEWMLKNRPDQLGLAIRRLCEVSEDIQ